LFTLIATKESGYLQFSTTFRDGALIDANDLNGGLWPYESLKGNTGSVSLPYIGLMQAGLTAKQGNIYDTPLDTAWNWLGNAQVAYDIFLNKVGYVFTAENKALNDHKGLSPLTQSQIEDDVMWQYSGNVSKTGITSLRAQYYVPKKVSGNWQWVPKPPSPNYVTLVRGSTPPNTSCN
jgi:hypothetical protein